MKVTLRNIINAREAFTSLANQSSAIIKAGVRFILSEDLNSIKNKIESVGRAQGELMLKHNINVQTTLIASPEYQSYLLDWEDILDTEIELETEPFLTKVILTDDRCTLTGLEMSQLKFLRVDESKVEKEKVEESK